MFKKRRTKRIAKKTEESNLNKVSQGHLDYHNENIKDIEKKSESSEEAHKLFKDSKSQKKSKKVRRFVKKEK